MSRFTIYDLAAIIDARAASAAEASYTRKLLDKGAEHCAKKLGEEAVETVIAAVKGDTQGLVSESADLIYHWLVVLGIAGVPLDDVLRELEGRTGRSGVAEKASRSKGSTAPRRRSKKPSSSRPRRA